jgi:DNA-binding transcriptional ArsR family regulator
MRRGFIDNQIVLKRFGYEMNASEQLDATFLALSDPTRRAILARLAEGEASVAELAQPFAISQPAVSKHLKILERAGLISGSQEATRRPRRLEAAPMAAAVGWLEKYRAFWEQSYMRLDSLLEILQTPINTAEKANPSGKRIDGDA